MKIDKLLKTVLLCSLFLCLLACSDAKEPEVKDTETNMTNKLGNRWYDSTQVSLGKVVYEANCISCHFENAKGTLNWRKTLEDGSYPPPPLNGTAHAWHHSISVLLTVINDGGVPNGGTMPAFRNSLSQDQKLAVIAYFQSFWTADIYSKWADVHRRQP